MRARELGLLAAGGTEKLAALGISEGLVRLSGGLEDAEDLIGG